jgi:DNA-binding winged helix-turn-helix (wHTH) protein/tetratricopeptide (TPR) repeat protein
MSGPGGSGVVTTAGPQIIALGDFTLDLAQGRLVSAKGEVQLRPKAFQLLATLAGHRGAVVSKDDLMAEVWPDVIVTEDSLTQCVHEIRAALGPEASGLLRTVPRRGYTLTGPGIGVTLPSEDEIAVSPGSLAVMPFLLPEGLDPHHRLLFDGLTHDVISRLARLRSYRVTGRGSVFALRGFAEDAVRLRQLLRVAFVVSGRVEVQEPGRSFRLVIDLVRTADGSLEWVDEVSVSSDALHSLSTEIAERLVSTIALAVTESEKRRALSDHGNGQTAWEEFHRGLDKAFRFSLDQMRGALAHFRTATDLDPKFARAHAYASFCNYYFTFTGRLDDRAAGVREARDWASRAVDADALSPVAQWAQGRALWLAGDPEQGKAHIAQAVALCPSFPNAHYMLGFIECFHGDARAALAHLATSEEQSPFDPFLASIQLTRATAHLRLGDQDRAVHWAGLASRHRTAYGQMLYHAALILETAGARTAASQTLAELSVRDPTYDTSRYFGSHSDLPDDIAPAFRKAQASLVR